MDDTEPDLARLREEIPVLYRARAFANAVSEARFFTRLGEALDEREARLAELFLEGLGFPGAQPQPLASWAEAADAALVLDVDPDAWQADEMLRAGLTADVLAVLDEQALHAGLALVAEKIGEAARTACEDAAAMADVEDEALVNAAVGAAAHAAHCAVLALFVAKADDPGGADHPYLARYQLFARGRWPVGLAGMTYNVF